MPPLWVPPSPCCTHSSHSLQKWNHMSFPLLCVPLQPIPVSPVRAGTLPVFTSGPRTQGLALSWHSVSTCGISGSSGVLQKSSTGSSASGNLSASPSPDPWMLESLHLRTDFYQTQRWLADHAPRTNGTAGQWEPSDHWSKVQRAFAEP